jgi:3-isopropylmalate dehydratase small subunit
MPEMTSVLEGRTWVIRRDNIDTDMIFHNRYLAITETKEMGQYTFDNLKGFEDFSKKAMAGDIIITGKNFGCGSSRQQAVDCFSSLGIQAVVAESFGAIYERNAINAAFPILICKELADLDLKNGDGINVNLKSGRIENLSNKKTIQAEPFSDVQFEVYQNGGLLGK